MKRNIYIVLILICSYSFSNAQSNTEVFVTEMIQNFSALENDGDTITTMNYVLHAETENNVLLLTKDEFEEKEVARNVSDIRIYLNRVRNIHNIHLLFPNKNKTKIA